MILNSPYISGSLTVTGNEVVTGSLTVLGGITGAITGSATSASYASNAELLDGLDSSVFVPTGSFNAFSSSILSYTASNNSNIESIYATTASLNTFSGSANGRLNSIESTTSSLNLASGSAITRLNTLESKTGSYATTGSNIFVDGQYLNSSFNPISFTSTASLYTDGGLRVTRDAYISGTLYLNNVTIYGTQSVAFITSSQLNISNNLISVNTATPTVRFGGLAVYDSGSTGLTGSILWDSENNHWVYTNPSGSTYSGGMLISGPRAASLGTEQGTTNCALMMGQGGDHITSSAIFHYGNATCFYGNSFVSSSGLACFAGTICAPAFVGGTVSGTTGVFSSSVTGTSFITDGSTLFGITLKGRAADNFGAIGFYSSNGVTRYGYIQSHSSNNGQLNINADGGAQIIGDCRGLLLQPSSGNVGIGVISPTQKLVIGCSAGLPAISGTTQTDGLIRLLSTSNAVVDMGMGQSSCGFWIQVGDRTDLNPIYAYPLLLQPNGGNIGIRCTSPGFTLDVNGTLNVCTSTGSQIRMISYGGSSAKIRGTQGTLGIEACGALTLETNGANERLRIESSGIACFACRVCAAGAVITGDICLGIGTGSYDQVIMCYSGYNAASPTVTLMPTTVPGSGALTTFFLLRSNGVGFGNTGCNHMGLNVQSTTYLASCNGSVGIGTTNPLASLHIDSPNSGATGQQMLRITRNSVSQGIKLMNYDGGTGVEGYSLKTIGDIDLIHFKMDGRIGIGTTTPGSLLHTSGTSNIFKHFTTANNGTWIEFQANSTNVVRPFYVGQDNSAGGSFGVGGYAGVIFTSSGDPVVLATASTARLTVAGNGIACFSCTVCAPVFVANSTVISGYFRTADGSTAVPHATGTTIFSIPANTANAVFQVFVQYPSGVPDVNNYTSYATILFDGQAARIIANNGGASCIFLSGLDVRVAQGSGFPLTASWKYLRM